MRLVSYHHAATEYTFDDNGNMISDVNKGITNIMYNHLNLPEVITLTTGTITFLYDANGNKLSKTVSTGTQKDYLGGIEYNNGAIEAVYHEEGRATFNGTWQYEYYLKDHLGNTRVIFADSNNDGTPEIIQEADYYPFGMRHDRSITATNHYLYNGKELNTDLGLDWYDYGARWLDVETGRWSSIDPLSESFSYESPFAHVGNNPIKYVDFDGKEKIVVTGGEYTDAKRYKYNFVEPAINQLKQFSETTNSEPITWVIMNAGYSDSDITLFRFVASELGVGIEVLNSAQELTNYLNSKDASSTNLSQSRSADPITSIAIFGHGFAGSAEFGYRQGTTMETQFSWGMSDVANLNPLSFNNSNICFYTCNAGTSVSGDGFGNSLIRKFANTTNSDVSGYWGRSDYAKMNQGEGRLHKLNRSINGFNPYGSVHLPTAGTKSPLVPSTWIRIKRNGN